VRHAETGGKSDKHAPQLRKATPEDADSLAWLINYAGEGMPLYLWSTMAEDGESAWDIGRRRARREEGGFSYRNAQVLDLDGTVLACLIGYPLPDRPAVIDYDNTPAMFVPLEELEQLAPGTWYVNVLAAEPRTRGQGFGTRLLSVADELAAANGKAGLSLITSDTNSGAQRLYERCGYRVVSDRKMVKDGWQSDSERWLLMTKTL